MSWWNTSWLPWLPSLDFSLPSGIQRRFISFALKRSLGHFLKPGQLDIQQIDSQIGSGYVQVRDLELNNEAINALLSGLPLELQDGSVGKVTARLPWPNPLTSSIGLSFESLHLTFYLAPESSKMSTSTADLAESVASVAESFMHEELQHDEEDSLRESLHSDATTRGTGNPPGGLDPFITDEETVKSEKEPSGISVFATLIERLLARFAFDAVDTKITLVHPQHASFTLVVPEIRYRTEDSVLEGGQTMSGEVRTATISGICVTTRSLSLASTQNQTPSASSNPSPGSTSFNQADLDIPSTSPPSPISDSSDMDEDTQMLMSQSIAFLPARPESPSSSVASTMYESAVSAAAPLESEDNLTLRQSVLSSSSPDIHAATTSMPIYPSRPPIATQVSSRRITDEVEDETIISLASESVVVKLMTPPRNPSSQTQASSSRPAAEADGRTGNKRPSDEKLSLSVKIGIIACAIRARHLRAILDAAHVWSLHSPTSLPTRESDQATSVEARTLIMDVLEANVQLRGVVTLVLPAPRVGQTSSDDEEQLFDYFKHPLVPPKLSHGFVRIHLGELSASLATHGQSATFGSSSSPVRSRKRKSSVANSTSVMKVSATLSELSVFAFVSVEEPARHQSATDFAKLSASPILITDPHLLSQYQSQHMHLPTENGDPRHHSLPDFDVIDWTAPTHLSGAAKPSLWRTKAPQSSSSRGHHHINHSSSSIPHQRSPQSKVSELTTFSSPPSIPLSNTAAESPQGKSARGLGTMSRAADATQRSHGPAISINMRIPSTSRTDRPSRRQESQIETEISFQPLSIFMDLDLILGRVGQHYPSEAVLFVNEILVSHAGSGGDEGLGGGDEDYEEDINHGDSDSQPSTPRARPIVIGPLETEKERERERRRLELLVLEDLDLGFDYRREDSPNRIQEASSRVQSWQKKRTKTKRMLSTTIIFTMLRLQIRCPPPDSHIPRSGSIVIDLHRLKIKPSGSLDQGIPVSLFARQENLYLSQAMPTEQPHSEENTLLSAHWDRIVIAYAPVSSSRASAVLSVGPMPSNGHKQETVRFASEVGPEHRGLISETVPQMSIRRISPKAIPSLPNVSAISISLDIPSVHIEMSKPALDGLQLWCDDLTQLLGHSLSESRLRESGTEKAVGRDVSLIGSRYFAKRTGSQASDTGSGTGSVSTSKMGRDETSLQVTVGKAFIRLMLPNSGEETGSIRPFDIVASEVDALIELKPEGRDETVVTLGIMDITVKEHAKIGPTTLISTSAEMLNIDSHSRSALKVRFISLVVPETTAKESRIKVTLSGITHQLYPNYDWMTDIGVFLKAPPGAFESVVPSERTRISVAIVDCSICMQAPSHPGALVTYVGELDFSTVIVGDSAEMSFRLEVPALSWLLIDDASAASESSELPKKVASDSVSSSILYWREAGYASLADIANLDLKYIRRDASPSSHTRILVSRGRLQVHLCADTITALIAFISSLTAHFQPSSAETAKMSPKKRTEPTRLTQLSHSSSSLLSSLDEQAFRQLPEVGSEPDMIHDDLPTNQDFLDESFGAAAGLRELDDDEFDDFDMNSSPVVSPTDSTQSTYASTFGGETIKMLRPEGLQIIDHYFDTMPPDSIDGASSFGETTLRIQVQDCDVTLFLYDGYDWARTRKIIEEEQKDMRRRLAKIRQLVASGQTPDPSVEETNTLLFNSVYIGLEHNVDELEPGALIAAIDEELNDELDTASQSSWQSFKPSAAHSPGKSGPSLSRSRRKRMSRSKNPYIEFRLTGLNAEVDHYIPGAESVSRTLVTARDVEILDHIKTSTWRKFLTALREDSRGNIRETDSDMVRIELRTLHPVLDHPSEEARLRAKILPLRLHVDQDALDFLKKFFSFKDPDSPSPSNAQPSEETYIQQAEVFPIDIKLDYKPRRVDYRALRDGRTIELMNFFHFDGAEMTLRHITLTGITGWPRLFDLLNDLWTPDVKATQLVDVISGVSPIRSVVNVGSGVADLVLLPIAQYKKDGRVVRGLQKGTKAFVKSTATEAVKLGAKLATGTQVILEQAENVIGGQFKDPVTAEAVQVSPLLSESGDPLTDEDEDDLISRYAQQPMNVQEGVQSAYRSLKKNLNSAAQTILAVPMEVYERSGNEGPVRAVVRAVPIAVLKPMIGASEAVSKTLLGLHNSLDPNVRHENEAKYKQR